MLLEVTDIEAGYGKNKVLNGVSLSLERGEIIALLGHNGAGKTTTLKAILGLVMPTKGNVFYRDQDMIQDSPAAKVKKGMVLVLQEKSIFTDLTTMANLEVSSHIISDRSQVNEHIKIVNDLFPILEKRATQRAGTLSGGEQRMLAIGMGLMLEPALFMLDEPSVGLSPLMVQNVIDAIKKINRRLGSAILLVEQNIQEALTIASRACIMKSGQIIMDETSSHLLEMENLWHFL